jgi:hypothetical protein
VPVDHPVADRHAHDGGAVGGLDELDAELAADLVGFVHGVGHRPESGARGRVPADVSSAARERRLRDELVSIVLHRRYGGHRFVISAAGGGREHRCGG